MKKCNRRKNSLLTIGVVMVMSTIILSCHKMGLYQQLPGDPYIVVDDGQNKNNKASKAIIKDANDKVSTAYYVEIKSTGTKSTLTPDLVVDTLLISIPPDVDPMNIKVVPQFLNTSMTAVKIVDTNKIRGFEVQDTVKLQLTNGTYHNYTLVDNEGLLITFSNGYQRKYVILAEVLSYVPPRIYDLGSYTGGLDSIGYDDANQTITIYRSPFNTDLKQILDYKFEPANAIIAPSYLPGAEFDFAILPTYYPDNTKSANIINGWYTPVTKTMTIPIQVPNKTGGMESISYKLILHVGFRTFNKVLVRAGATRDKTNFFTATIATGSNDYDEMAIAVNENYVYVLRLRGDAGTAPAAGWSTTYTGYRKGDIFAYSLKDANTSPIQLSVPTPQGLGKDSFPPICDIMISGTKLIGMGYTSRPSGGTTGTTSIAKLFFISWDADNPANYTLGDSLDVSLYSPTGGRTSITVLKGNLEGNITKEGAQFYGFHIGALYAGTGVLYPGCKSAKLVIDGSGAVRVATKGAGLDTVSYYFNVPQASLITTLSGRAYFQNIPFSEGGGSILGSINALYYMKSPVKGEVSTNPTTATNSLLLASLHNTASGTLNNNLTTTVFGGTAVNNQNLGLQYFNYGGMNYMACMDWLNGNSIYPVGISIYALGTNPIFKERVPFKLDGTSFTFGTLRVARQVIDNTSKPWTNAAGRGGIAQYRMPDGKVRIAVLVPNSGFGVFDFK